MHDELDCDVWKTEIMEARVMEIPIDIIKSFLQVKFESYVALLLLGSSHEVDNFL